MDTRKAIALAAGAVLLAALGFSQLHERAPMVVDAAPPPPPPQAAAPAAQLGSAREDARSQAQLEARVTELTERLAALEAANRPRPPPPPETEEERAERARNLTEEVVASLENDLAAHRSSAVDAAWAAQARSTIERDLEPMLKSGESKAIVEGVECRSSSCVTTLRFASRDEALAGYLDFVTTPYQVPCTTTAILPEANATGEVKVEVLFLKCNG